MIEAGDAVAPNVLPSRFQRCQSAESLLAEQTTTLPTVKLSVIGGASGDIVDLSIFQPISNDKDISNKSRYMVNKIAVSTQVKEKLATPGSLTISESSNRSASSTLAPTEEPSEQPTMRGKKLDHDFWYMLDYHKKFVIPIEQVNMYGVTVGLGGPDEPLDLTPDFEQRMLAVSTGRDSANVLWFSRKPVREVIHAHGSNKIRFVLQKPAFEALIDVGFLFLHDFDALLSKLHRLEDMNVKFVERYDSMLRTDAQMILIFFHIGRNWTR